MDETLKEIRWQLSKISDDLGVKLSQGHPFAFHYQTYAFVIFSKKEPIRRFVIESFPRNCGVLIMYDFLNFTKIEKCFGEKVFKKVLDIMLKRMASGGVIAVLGHDGNFEKEKECAEKLGFRMVASYANPTHHRLQSTFVYET